MYKSASTYRIDNRISHYFARVAALVVITTFASIERTDKPYKNSLIYKLSKSFKDSNGDGIGDLNGITGRLASMCYGCHQSL